jgi:hypothetical protein
MLEIGQKADFFSQKENREEEAMYRHTCKTAKR